MTALLLKLITSGTLATAIGWLGKIVLTLLNNRRYRKGLRDISDVTDYMQDVINNTHANRFLILALSNGGGYPTAKKNMYVTVLHECNDSKVRSIKTMVQNVIADPSYVRLVARLASEVVIEMETLAMEDGFLKRVYENDKITHSYLFYIKRTKGTTFYGSISTIEGRPFIDNQSFESIHLNKGKIIQKF